MKNARATLAEGVANKDSDLPVCVSFIAICINNELTSHRVPLCITSSVASTNGWFEWHGATVVHISQVVHAQHVVIKYA